MCQLPSAKGLGGEESNSLEYDINKVMPRC